MRTPSSRNAAIRSADWSRSSSTQLSVISSSSNPPGRLNSLNAAGTSGYQILTFNPGKTGTDFVGLANSSTVFTLYVYIDSVLYTPTAVGEDNQTWTELLATLNAQVTAANFALVGGNLVVTSNSTGTSSTVLLDEFNGNMLSSFNDWDTFQTPVAGTNGSTYTASVVVNGGAPQPISIA